MRRLGVPGPTQNDHIPSSPLGSTNHMINTVETIVDAGTRTCDDVEQGLCSRRASERARRSTAQRLRSGCPTCFQRRSDLLTPPI